MLLEPFRVELAFEADSDTAGAPPVAARPVRHADPFAGVPDHLKEL